MRTIPFQKKVKVSIIVTVHNSEKFLKESLDSVCGQTLKDIEILCIDGGSEDTSPAILEKFSQQDERIRIINDSNTSYGHKINVGIHYAKGEYIGILETDDVMEPDMLETLYCIAQEYQPDYVDGDYYNFFCLDGRRYRYHVKKYPIGDAYGYLCEGDANFFGVKQGAMAIWTGIYRRGFLLEQNIRMNESPGASFQDTSFRFLVSTICKTSYHVESPIYNYRIDNVDSSVKDMSKVNVIVDEYSYLRKALLERGVTAPVIWQNFYIRKYSGYYWNLLRLEGEARDTFLNTYKAEIESDIKNGRIETETLDFMDYIRMAMVLKEPERFMEYAEGDRKQQMILLRVESMLDFIKGKDVVVFGCGKRGKLIFELLDSWRTQIRCFCDNDIALQGKTVQDFPILRADMARELYPNAVYIIASRYYAQEIKGQLGLLGIKEESIYIF